MYPERRKPLCVDPERGEHSVVRDGTETDIAGHEWDVTRYADGSCTYHGAMVGDTHYDADGNEC